MAKRRIKGWVPAAAIALVAVGFGLWLKNGTSPMASGAKTYIRYEHPLRLGFVLNDLEGRGIVRDHKAFQVYSWILRRPQSVAAGTYSLRPGMSAGEILRELTNPVRQYVRIPETNWARRTANLLQERDVVKADEYMALFNDPDQFRKDVSFPIDGRTLEGYLYPDTYDLPPLLGARAVILRQLKAFEKKVWTPLHPANLYRVLTVASMVQMESGRNADGSRIAGVIENRLSKNMPLQIDATILYGLQKWRRLTFADYRNVNSPYNTYLHTGLPPGPICSPTVKNIEAALHPEKHDYLFYVAMPTGETLYSKTYPEHLKRIKQRRKAMQQIKAEKDAS
jgi:UPF0755 protein